MPVILQRKACRTIGCDGEMIADGSTLLSSPPQYAHYCNVCGDRQNYRVRYPHSEHVPDMEQWV